jgi:hypothetical protein
MKQTIAIIDADRRESSAIAKKLAGRGYPLLLFTKDPDYFDALALEIMKNNPKANIELMGCEFHATWEADIIILDVEQGVEKIVAEKIGQVATRKIVMLLGNETSSKKFAELLPSSRIITISSISPNSALVHGEDEEAMKTVSAILKDLSVDIIEANSLIK